jgi:hypothetical protein
MVRQPKASNHPRLSQGEGIAAVLVLDYNGGHKFCLAPLDHL